MQTLSKTVWLVFVFLSASTWAGDHHSDGHHHGDSASMGEAGIAQQVTRTVVVTMADTMRFSPATVEVRKGETLEFIVRNTGKVKHEMVLGTAHDLKAHASLMKQHPGMEHNDDNMVSVEPGQEGRILWHFSHSEKVQFACLQPGHFEAGMKGVIQVKTVKGK